MAGVWQHVTAKPKKNRNRVMTPPGFSETTRNVVVELKSTEKLATMNGRFSLLMDEEPSTKTDQKDLVQKKNRQKPKDRDLEDKTDVTKTDSNFTNQTDAKNCVNPNATLENKPKSWADFEFEEQDNIAPQNTLTDWVSPNKSVAFEPPNVKPGSTPTKKVTIQKGRSPSLRKKTTTFESLYEIYSHVTETKLNEEQAADLVAEHLSCQMNRIFDRQFGLNVMKLTRKKKGYLIKYFVQATKIPEFDWSCIDQDLEIETLKSHQIEIRLKN